MMGKPVVDQLAFLSFYATVATNAVKTVPYLSPIYINIVDK